jgi:lysophospholipase L1-like esterase
VQTSLRMVSIGDSVLWGQGLLSGEKFDVLVQAALCRQYPGGVTLEALAHSGAVIADVADEGSARPGEGEVPAADPSLLEQCDSFANAPEGVDVLLICGGINDVGVATILNPLAQTLGRLVTRACYHDMSELLVAVRAKFRKPTCKILVLGYYPILSAKSDPGSSTNLLAAFGLSRPDGLTQNADFLNPVVERCGDFFRESTRQLSKAVARTGDSRIQFLSSGFSDDSAVFVPGTSLLWGLDLNNGLGPEDPVAAQRHAQCAAAYSAADQVLKRLICFRASVGHPNLGGARQYAARILAALA